MTKEELNDLNDLSENVLEEEIKEEENETSETSETSENIFVNNPSISSEYKKNLMKAYNELNSIKSDEIQEKIDDIKNQIHDLIIDIDSSEEKIREINVKEFDNSMKEEPDYHYFRKTKPNIIKKAKDEDSFFTPTNICILGLALTIVVVGIIILCRI